MLCLTPGFNTNIALVYTCFSMSSSDTGIYFPLYSRIFKSPSALCSLLRTEFCPAIISYIEYSDFIWLVSMILFPISGIVPFVVLRHWFISVFLSPRFSIHALIMFHNLVV